MSYVYKITNNLNQKLYIGKTDFSIEKRWLEHCNERLRSQSQDRPLYRAMNKYGIEHFSIEIIEECSIDQVYSREIYWIEYYGSFKNGYNATSGGEGRSYLDYDTIFALYNTGISIAETARIMGISLDSVQHALDIYQISIADRIQRGIDVLSQPVLQLDKITLKILGIFPSLNAAGRYIVEKNNLNPSNEKGAKAHISDVCKGIRQTAYGYKWKFAN